jgi:hypothetical protein
MGGGVFGSIVISLTIQKLIWKGRIFGPIKFKNRHSIIEQARTTFAYCDVGAHDSDERNLFGFIKVKSDTLFENVQCNTFIC